MIVSGTTIWMSLDRRDALLRWFDCRGEVFEMRRGGLAYLTRTINDAIDSRDDLFARVSSFLRPPADAGPRFAPDGASRRAR